MNRNEKVFVTQPYLPPLQEFIPYLEKIWNSKALTNCGPFHEQLEQVLCEHLGVEHIALVANGTLALVTALQSLRMRVDHGEGRLAVRPFASVDRSAFSASCASV